MKPIPFISFDRQHAEIRTEVLSALTNIYDKNWFILGEELSKFESEYANFSGCAHCVGVGNGLDALFIALMAAGVGPGDEVIVPSHTFLATWLAVARTGAKIVGVDPDPRTFNLDIKSLNHVDTTNIKAIIPVHLYGQPCDMTGVEDLRRKGILIIEDNAQSHGATWYGRATGSLGDISATSFYPVKNLGALGDGGALVTDNGEFAEYARRCRNYGFVIKNVAEIQGVNSRLDEIQAAVLRIKLKHLRQWNLERAKLASTYNNQLASIDDVLLPTLTAGASHVYHQYVVTTSRRDELRDYLSSLGVGTGIHYPLPPHMQKSFADLGYRKGDFPVAERLAQTVLSLPMWPGLEESSVEYVCDSIKKFFNRA